MMSKAEKTTQFIIEKVAPVFNQNGYVGTSMSDITKVTGLTKGAVYGNFDSKEHLAIEAFNYTVRKVVGLIADKVNGVESAIEKMKAITDFYRGYYKHVQKLGGCPILNVSVDTINTNSALNKRVNEIITKLQNNIANIIDLGKSQGDFSLGVDTEMMAQKLYSVIQGSVFTALMTKNKNHLTLMMDHVELIISNELKE